MSDEQEHGGARRPHEDDAKPDQTSEAAEETSTEETSTESEPTNTSEETDGSAEPTSDGASQPPSDGGDATGREGGDTFFGIPLHSLIFVGMILGVIFGLVTHAIDHHDTLRMQPGVKAADGTPLEEIAGKVRHKKAEHYFTDHNGIETQIKAAVYERIEKTNPQAKLRVVEAEYVVMDPTGAEHRFPATQVREWVKAEGTDSGKLYANLVWWFSFFGITIFLGALKMIIAPLILCSIIAGIVSLKGLAQLKHIGLKTLGYYVCTTLFAVTLGLVMVLTIQPGHKAASQKIRAQRVAKLEARMDQYESDSARRLPAEGGKRKATPAFLEWIAAVEAREAGTGHEAGRFRTLTDAKGTSARDILKDSLVSPMLTNPFRSLTFSRSLGIISFALLLGIAIVVLGGKAKSVGEFFVGFNEVILLITKWLMKMAPFCVMCIVAALVAKEGPEVFVTLAWYCITVIAGIFIHVGVLLAICNFVGGVSPLMLWAGLREALLIAFTTRSSAATLPVTLRCVIEQLKVSPKVANFALPVGATMNMDGTALYEGVAVIFLLQIYAGVADVPIEMSAAVTFLIFITAVMASVGAAAVPDAGLVTMVLVAEAVGLPVYYIPLIFAVDAFLDMFRTTTNVLGDSVGAIVVARWEKRRGALD